MSQSPHDAQAVAEQHFATTYAPQRNPSFFLSIAGFAVVLWATSLVPVVQRFLRVTPLQLGLAMLVQVASILVATVCFRYGGALGRPHRVAERLETAANAGAAAALIVLSGSATSFFWFLTVTHLVHNASDALTARFMFRAHAVALLCAAVAFAARGQLADAVLIAFAAGVVLLSGGARSKGLWAQMHLEAERNRLQSEVEALLVQRERRRIARDLHDGPASHLAAVAWSADALVLEPALDSHEVRDQLREISERARQGMADLRDVAQGLVLEDTSVGTLLKALERGSVLPPRCRLVLECQGEATLRPVVFEQLLLAGREALLNVAKHAHASAVHVHLTLHGEDLDLAITDDGRGLPADASTRSAGGLSNLRDRAALLGAVLTLDGHAGTRIGLRVPQAVQSGDGVTRA